MAKKNYSSEYMKIRRYVLNRIHRTGGRPIQLPTAQELAARFGVSRPTVCKAMKALTEDGYVIGRPGIGSFTNPAMNGVGKGGNMDNMPIVGILIGDGMIVHYEIFYGDILARLLQEVIHYPALAHILNLDSGDADRNAKQILAEDLDALFWLSPQKTGNRTAEILRANGLPVVTMESESVPGTDNIYFNNDELGVDIAKKLLERNCRHVVFLADRDPWNKPRTGLLRTYAEAGIPLNEKLFLNECEGSLTRLHDFFELGVPIDAVVNPLFFAEKVTSIFDSVGADLMKKCTFVHNGLYPGAEKLPGAILYTLPVAGYVEAASNRMRVLLANPRAVPQEINVHVRVEENPAE